MQHIIQSLPSKSRKLADAASTPVQQRLNRRAMTIV